MSEQENKLDYLPIDSIDDPAYAMRTDTDVTALHELSQSIRQVGLLEPIIVRASGDRYEVVAGHRRLQAAKMAGLATIKSIVIVADDKETETIKIHENLFREDVDPVDEAFFIADAMKRLEVGIPEFALKINRSEQYIKDRLLITTYEDYILRYLKAKKLPLSVAKILSIISEPAQRKLLIDHAADNGITAPVARIWAQQHNQQTLPIFSEQIDTSALPLDVPTKIWTIECVICGGQIPAKEARLSYQHGECLDTIKRT
mgnify:CR=1 FL=1